MDWLGDADFKDLRSGVILSTRVVCTLRVHGLVRVPVKVAWMVFFPRYVGALFS